MPKIDPELRASLCAFTHANGRRCRQPRSASGDGYCYTHARKIRNQQEADLVVDLLTQPMAHPAIASTNLTFMLARLFAAVAEGRIQPKTSNALLRVADAMRRTIPHTTREYYNAFDPRKLHRTIRALYEEHANFIAPEDDEPAAPSAAPGPDMVGAELACPESGRRTPPSSKPKPELPSAHPAPRGEPKTQAVSEPSPS